MKIVFLFAFYLSISVHSNLFAQNTIPCTEIGDSLFRTEWKQDTLGNTGKRALYYRPILSSRTQIKDFFPVGISQTCLLEQLGFPNRLFDMKDGRLVFWYNISAMCPDKDPASCQGLFLEATIINHLVSEYIVVLN